ncbi:hypothetical protein D0864_15322 [Hortaea werneckii]|uniref:tRNA (guanine(10)-N(2))-methyltransferase n=1 Tax=Hortaea werneckii TaxID=91943 RepID=A0A3M7C355_HORWE|nr:RNA methylase family UPF0020 protein [Hortaea werneckii]KAI7605237.1 RNA methylase family UPF0020 protein [Hortaea werneckii]KAI7665204.1 RNA methylase family UPF0020 protein [Hortaea werneckii]KAI7691431.1 RNA methylase family UPF0020 protein [Hortaea werneckii]RMY46077.1 hypothetical protein D0864_15322 [Hortaea werneckii]
MDYLIRFVQQHETFRRPEIESLADLAGYSLEWLSYSDHSPFAIIRFKQAEITDTAIQTVIQRSILCDQIYELWGSVGGSNYDLLRQDITSRTQHLWPQYRTSSFRFTVDSYHGKLSLTEQRDLIESFDFMSFEGPVRMKKPDQHFTIFEDYELDAKLPYHLYFGRLIGEGGRKAINLYNLKKRSYIATTSMDAELSLITANLTQAGPGKLAYDPFMGTGSFPLACAHFGAVVFGSDLDGRSIRGKGSRSVRNNFHQYHTAHLYLGGFIADLTNSPLRTSTFPHHPDPTENNQDKHERHSNLLPPLDAILCDPPYGVREGLKVLGSTRAHLHEVVHLADGTPAHLQANYLPPKRPYSLVRMLEDILEFAAERLCEGRGRLGLWMPVAGAVAGDSEGEGEVGEEEQSRQQQPPPPASSGKEAVNPSIPTTATPTTADPSSPANPPNLSPPAHQQPPPTETESEDQEIIPIPTHPALRLAHTSQQDFNKWSRRLLIYVRLPEAEVPAEEIRMFREKRAERERREREEREREREWDWSGKRDVQQGGGGGEGESGGQASGEREGDGEGMRKGKKKGGQTADELNAFRKRYFQGFREV